MPNTQQTNTSKLDPSIMAAFTCSEHWYRHALNRKVTFTDGAKYVADMAGACWLLDEIALSQISKKAVAAEEFQVWKLKVNANNSGRLTCEDGNCHIVYTKKISFTDFPLPEITLWFTNNVIFLPSEY